MQDEIPPLNRINECGLLIDHFFEIFDKLVERGVERSTALESSSSLINSFIMYKAGIVIMEESCSAPMAEED